MFAAVTSLALVGIEAKPVQIQVQISSGIPSFTIVGLADKSVYESQSRIKAALVSMGLALPPKRITINLQPANQPKEGSHYDLPIALGLMTAMGVIAADQIEGWVCLGELGLDGQIISVPGALPAAVMAADMGKGLICPQDNGAEASWVQGLSILASDHLLQLVAHFKGKHAIAPLQDLPQGSSRDDNKFSPILPDMADIQGQPMARRALEIAAVGGHHLLMIGPPGAGKSMLAQRIIGILPPLTANEALDVSIIQSVAGLLQGGQLQYHRPFRDPHYSTSMPAMVGGGSKARPGEITLAHHGVLFLDELPEFSRTTLEALRQPIETATVTVARVNAHITYPARFQLIAAMNPCRCGKAMDNDHYCAKFPRCALDYQSKISGPLMDRFDIHLAVPKMSMRDMLRRQPEESSATITQRVVNARRFAAARWQEKEKAGQLPWKSESITHNAALPAQDLETLINLDESARQLLLRMSDRHMLSARGYHRLLRVSRSLADMNGVDSVSKTHVTEAMCFRRIDPA